MILLIIHPPPTARKCESIPPRPTPIHDIKYTPPPQDAKVYGYATTAIHDHETPPPPKIVHITENSLPIAQKYLPR